MDTTNQADKPAPFILMTTRQLIGTAIVGIATGLFAWGAALLFKIYVFEAMFCQSMMTAQCAAAPQYATIAANVLAIGASVFALVRLEVFRPLLVGLGSIVSLWGLSHVLVSSSWQINALIFAGIFGVAYLAFAWIARLRSFGLSIVVMVVLAVAVRFVLNS